jgi:predicted tellurium resistance membrane protein TerC
VLTLLGQGFSGRDLVLLAGGLFLMAKSSHELFLSTESEATGPREKAGPTPLGAEKKERENEKAKPGGARFGLLLTQILLLDVVFSLDSVITAVGMAQQISIMAAAMVIAVLIMLLAANVVSEFITRHPSMKVLALSFLLMIGVLLLADAFGKHIDKGYVYFAMAYALGVELINLRRRKARDAAGGEIAAGKTSQG